MFPSDQILLEICEGVSPTVERALSPVYPGLDVQLNPRERVQAYAQQLNRVLHMCHPLVAMCKRVNERGICIDLGLAQAYMAGLTLRAHIAER